MIAVLERRLERADELVGIASGRSSASVLDRLEAATERRDPVVADLARQLRNRYYDQPVIAQRREEAYAEMSAQLDALVGRRARRARRRRRGLPAAARAAAHRAAWRRRRPSIAPWCSR